MDKLEATVLSKNVLEKQVLHDNTCIWNVFAMQ